MSFFAQLGQDIVLPLVAIWETVIESLPGVIGGLLILFFGFLLAEVVQLLVTKGLRKINFDKFLHSLKISKKLEHFDIIHFLGVLLKWYILVIFLRPAASMARLGSLSLVILDFARWLPNFLLAIFIMVAAWVGADVLVSKIHGTEIKEKHLIALFTKSFILLFALVVALQKVGVSMALMNISYIILLSSFAFGIALAFGIGFGFAVKDEAKKAIKHVKKKFN